MPSLIFALSLSRVSSRELRCTASVRIVRRLASQRVWFTRAERSESTDDGGRQRVHAFIDRRRARPHLRHPNDRVLLERGVARCAAICQSLWFSNCARQEYRECRLEDASTGNGMVCPSPKMMTALAKLCSLRQREGRLANRLSNSCTLVVHDD